MANARYGQVRYGVSRYWPEGPDTAQEYIDQPYWMRDVGGTNEGDGSDNQADGELSDTTNDTPGDIGGGTVGGGGPPAPSQPSGGPGGALPPVFGEGGEPGYPGYIEPTATNLTYSRTAPFTLELYDDEDDKIATISAWSKGGCSLPQDMASTFSFRIAGTDALVSQIVPPNRVWLRDAWGMLMERGDIVKKRKIRDGDAVFIDVSCLNVLSKFKDEVIDSYSTGFDANGDPVTVEIEDLIPEILAFQTKKPIVGLGHIDYTMAKTKLSFNVKNKTVQQALFYLQALMRQAWAGHFIVTTKNELEWRAHLGGYSGQTIELGKGLQGADVDIDYGDQVDRAHFYGAGNEVANSLSLTDAGYSADHIDRTGIDLTDYRGRTIIRRSYIDAETLGRAAERYIEEHAGPRIQITIQAIDLSKADTAGFEDIDAIYPGTEYRVIDAGMDIDDYVWVKTVTYPDLGNPLRIELELGNRTKELADVFSDIIDRLEQPFVIEDDGSRHPYILRVFPASYSPPEGHAYKNGDVKPDTNGVPEMYNATADEWVPITTWVPYNGS